MLKRGFTVYTFLCSSTQHEFAYAIGTVVRMESLIVPNRFIVLLTYDSLHLVTVEGRLRGSLLESGATPALTGDRARGQLAGTEQQSGQTPRQLPVVGPLHRSHLLLQQLDSLAELYLRTEASIIRNSNIAKKKTPYCLDENRYAEGAQ
jgi:hypothetical protein